MATAVRKKRGKSSPSAIEDAPSASNPLISDAKLKQLYSTMLQCRLLADRAQLFLRKSSRPTRTFGAEAAIAGATLDLRREDWLLPSQNDLLGRFVKGKPLAKILPALRRSQTSQAKSSKGQPAKDPIEGDSSLYILSSAKNPAAQLNRAAGIALALQSQKTGNIVMAFCGDASSSSQRWQEALRFAGRHCLPLIVLTYSKASAKTGSATKTPFVSLLSEGNPCELPIIPVDADDIVAIYRVAYESIHKARHGGGPTLIQAISFIHPGAGKTSADKHPDAIAKMESYLAAKGLFSPSWKQDLLDNFNRDIESALKAENKPALRNRR